MLLSPRTIELVKVSKSESRILVVSAVDELTNLPIPTLSFITATLVKLMSGELLPTLGDIRPHGHLKMGRFTQHFVDVLELDMTPLEFFEREYPNDPREDQRKYLGRFGVSGRMQVQKMEELSDGQKSRVVFAKLGRDVPHIVSRAS